MKTRVLYLLLFIKGMMLIPFLANAAPQAIITVDSLADEMVNDGNCTLREAVEAANTNSPVDECRPGSSVFQDLIIFRDDGVIMLSDALVITQAVEIRGNGENVTILDGTTANLSTALVYASWVDGNPNMDLTHLTVQNAVSSTGLGGAIYSQSPVSLKVDHVTLSFNSAGNGGGIFTSGNITIQNSQFLSNTVTGSGGALHITNGTLTVEQSTFQGNLVQGSGGAIQLNNGTASISYGTFSQNRAESDLSTGGGLSLLNSLATITHSAILKNHAESSGGGLYLGNSQVTIINSTLSANSASLGGGIHANNNAIIDAHNNTFVANIGGGIVLFSSSAIFQDTIIGENEWVNCHSQFDSTLQSLGHNLIDFNTCQFDQPTDISTGQALFDSVLGPLQANGGTTLTHALLPGSAAIDAGHCSGLSIADDQRNVPRPQGQACDIGSFEYEGTLWKIYLPLISR
ncbi:MAG: hypothetical protein Fur0022_03250 [Anaerolineales bacterium]